MIFAGPLLAIAFTRAATTKPVLAVELVIFVVAVFSTARPDSHFGLLLLLLTGANWVFTVDSPTTAWVIGVAVSLALSHTAMAAASVAPPRAAWTTGMRRRWSFRFLTIALSAVPAWVLVKALDQTRPYSRPVLFTATLLALVLVGFWFRNRTLETSA